MPAVRINNPYGPAVITPTRDAASSAQGTPSRWFRHNPYDLETAVSYDELPGHTPSSRSESPAADTVVPAGALHVRLAGLVNFEPYPAVSRESAMVHFGKELCCRLFVGQIPYGAPASQIEWMVQVATGCRVYFTEPIHRWTSSRSPKGCAHTYCLPGDVDTIVQLLHRRMLVDDSGVWIAADEHQQHRLEEYCAALKADKALRHRDRPYQPVVVEGATSNFVPRRASPPPQPSAQQPHGMPPLYMDFVHAETAVLPPEPPPQEFLPPSYRYAATFAA
jgi:hypothetical protein